ncbi:MAG: hypothetical protein E6Q40_08825 [Cupriavidus sp.]|nr:MAG: hypothetical protein E6Q40_08825 [Cupriavidus sp.]
MRLASEATTITGGMSVGLAAGLGIDPVTVLTIVTTLLPLLAKCFQRDPSVSGQTPQQFLTDHYDPTTDTFDQHLIDRTRAQTRRAARKEGQRHLTRDQLDAITVESLKRAMKADNETVSACLAEAAALPDE